MTKRTRRTSLPEDDLDFLEAQLAGTLKPVTPPNDIVLRLKERIYMPAREQIAFRLRDWGSMFLVFGGVMSGMVLIITVARALYYFVGRRGMG
jgi:hypothetical protein